MKQRQQGFSQTEILTTLGIIAVVAAIAMPFVFNAVNTNQNMRKELNAKTNEVRGLFQNIESESGLMARSMSPNTLVQSKLSFKGQPVAVRDTSSLPSGCSSVETPARAYHLNDDKWQVIVSNNWTTGGNRTNDYTRICIKHETDALSQQLVVKRAGSSKGTLANAGTGVGGFTPTNPPAPTSAGAFSLEGIDPTAITVPPVAYIAPFIPLPDYPKFLWHAREKSKPARSYRDGTRNKILIDFLGSKLGDIWIPGWNNYAVSLFDMDGKIAKTIDNVTFRNSLKINFRRVDQAELDRVGWTKGLDGLSFDEALDLSTRFNPTCGGGGHPIELMNCVMSKGIKYDADGKPVLDKDGNPLTEGGNADLVLYTDEKGNTFQLPAGNGTWSPVKISLSPRDAIPSDENAFPLDVDGFSVQHFPPFMTTGGLEQDEAWLALDRKKNGFFNDDHVFDGEDAFGDHLGKYKSGYEDLAETFKGSLQKDKDGKRYIPIHKMNWFEEFWLWLTRLIGLNQEPNASYDLMLIKSTNDTVRASEVLTRIDVDYENVLEFSRSKMNRIYQRAEVTYLDGKKAQSGDQWFGAAFFLFMEPLAEKQASELEKSAVEAASKKAAAR